MPEKDNNFGFGSAAKRFKNLGIHPELTTINVSNPVGPGQYSPKYSECAYKNKSSSWTRKFKCEEFSKYLDFKNPELLCDREFKKTLGGPGNYNIGHELPTGPGILKNVGFGSGKRFDYAIKDETLPPGAHTIKELTTKFSKTPTFERDGFLPRFKPLEPLYRKAPNRYNLPDLSILNKKISKRGPYDTFTGPRDASTIKNHFAPPSFKTPDIIYKIPSPLDYLLLHPSKKRYGKFLQDERFPEGGNYVATKKGFTLFMRDEAFPGPALYKPSSSEVKPTNKNLSAFNSSNLHARPPPDWKIHPGPDRYEVKYPKCRTRKVNASWMFLSKADRSLVAVESYSNFLY